MTFKNLKNDEILQIIKKYTFGTVNDLIFSFDFTVTKFTLCKNDDDILTVAYDENYFSDLFDKKLNCGDVLLYPMSTYFRAFRYSNYGFTVTKECKKNILLKLCFQISDGLLDNEDILQLYDEELEDFIYEVLELEEK